MSQSTSRLTAENTNALAHRVTGDTLVYDCPNCEFGEVLITDLIEAADGKCLDCDARYRLYVEELSLEGDSA